MATDSPLPAWLIVAFGTGVGFLAYLIAWIVIPSDHGTAMQIAAATPA